MQKVEKCKLLKFAFASVAVFGACFISYESGKINESLKSNIIWNLNDLHTCKRLKNSALSKDDALLSIQNDAKYRHQILLARIDKSILASLLVRINTDLQKGIIETTEFKEDK